MYRSSLYYKRSASSSENVTIAGTIDGASNLVLAKAGEAVILFSTGLEWKVASTNNSSSSSEVWDDLLVHPDATTKGGSKAPAWGGKSANAFKNNSGSQGVFMDVFLLHKNKKFILLFKCLTHTK